MTTPTPQTVPDILAAIRGGKYPYDFVQALTGTQSTNLPHRRRMLDRLLAHPEGADALLAMLTIGARQIIDFIVNSDYKSDQDVDRMVTRLAAAKDDLTLDGLAGNPSDIGRRP